MNKDSLHIYAVFILAIAIIAAIGSQNLAAFATTEKYIASLSGQNEVPSVKTNAVGTAGFTAPHFNKITFGVSVNNMDQVTGAHIHQGKQGENGQVVATLFKAKTPTGKVNGHLVNGSISSDMLEGPLKGKTLEDLANLMRSGNSYVNVHTTKNPNGEIRGQIFGGG